MTLTAPSHSTLPSLRCDGSLWGSLDGSFSIHLEPTRVREVTDHVHTHEARIPVYVDCSNLPRTSGFERPVLLRTSVPGVASSE